MYFSIIFTLGFGTCIQTERKIRSVVNRRIPTTAAAAAAAAAVIAKAAAAAAMIAPLAAALVNARKERYAGILVAFVV